MACFSHYKKVHLRRFSQKSKNQRDKEVNKHHQFYQHIKKQGVDCYNR